MAPDFEFSHLLVNFAFQILIYLDDFLFVSYDNFPYAQALLGLLPWAFHAFSLTLHSNKCDWVAGVPAFWFRIPALSS